jgi:lipoprotein-releasing system ATP-binding protein
VAKPATEAVLRLAAVTRSYNIGLPSQTEVLHATDMALHRGEFLALMGPSG